MPFLLVQVGDICVRVSTIPKTFADATQTCKDDDGDLAYIPDRFAQQDLKELIQNKKPKQGYEHYIPVEVIDFMS